MVDNEDSTSMVGDGGFHRDGISGVGRRSSISVEGFDGGSLVAEDDVPSPKCNRFVQPTTKIMVLRAPRVFPPCKRKTWVYMMIIGMFSSANIANLSSSSLEFYMGAEVSIGSLPKASQSRPQGVWVNASSNPIQLASVLPQAGKCLKGIRGWVVLGNVQRGIEGAPEFLPLISYDDKIIECYGIGDCCHTRK